MALSIGASTRAPRGGEAFVPEPLRFPGYPLFIAPLCIVGCSHWAITLTQALLVAVLVIVVAKYASTMIGRRGGLIAGGLVALNPSFAFFGAHALSDLLAAALLIGSIAAAAVLIPRHVVIGGLLAGSLVAAATLTRPVFAFALPLALVVLTLRYGLRRTAAPALLAVLAFVVAVAPYLAYVESSFGRPLVGSGGAALIEAYFQGADESRLDATERAEQAAGRAAVARFDTVADRGEQARAWIALDDELRARALTLIAHDPWGFAARGLLRSVVLWAGDVPLRSEDITPTVAAFWRVGSLVWFGVGLLGAMRMLRRDDALSALPLLVIGVTWAVSYPLVAEGRYSLPAQPFVAIGIAAMLIRLGNPVPRLFSRADTQPPARSQA